MDERTVPDMSVQERILTIRLMEKLKACPAYAKAFGVEVTGMQPPKTAEKKEYET